MDNKFIILTLNGFFEYEKYLGSSFTLDVRYARRVKTKQEAVELLKKNGIERNSTIIELTDEEVGNLIKSRENG